MSDNPCAIHFHHQVILDPATFTALDELNQSAVRLGDNLQANGIAVNDMALQRNGLEVKWHLLLSFRVCRWVVARRAITCHGIYPRPFFHVVAKFLKRFGWLSGWHRCIYSWFNVPSASVSRSWGCGSVSHQRKGCRMRPCRPCAIPQVWHSPHSRITSHRLSLS